MQKTIQDSIFTSLIDRSYESILEFQPKLIFNDHQRGMKVLTNIQKELSNCVEFIFSIAFISNSGVNALLNELDSLRNRGILGTIITTDYLNFNDPVALRRLLQFNNIEFYVVTEKSLHTKGYIFVKPTYTKILIGSSNLTQEALTENIEWNIELSSTKEGKIIEEVFNEIAYVKSNAEKLTFEWIDDYEKRYVRPKFIPHYHHAKQQFLLPNSMQQNALRSLQELRSRTESKAIVISATGTGKTYLSAFDVRNFEAGRVLFAVHREQIAKASMDSFSRVCPSSKTYGLLSGTHKDIDSDYLFTTVQSISKDENLVLFEPTHFDYIIIDEAHRSGATTYKKILSYFTPKFLLGMTATPERSDDFNIYQLFDHNIAYEIRLQEALEEKLLCPFHYYGISDIEVNGKVIDDTTEFKNLVTLQRVNHIIDKVKFYGHSGNRPRGLMFCSRNEEAKELSFLLNREGLRTLALSGDNSQEQREEAIRRLVEDREDYLDCILTVDIFNEGVDIPEINQIVLLRPTSSAIIFVQQLGRGLRKAEDKEFVVVIDFIGNYKNNFFIPIALSGDRSLNSDTLKRFLVSGNSTIPGCSTVNFETVVSRRILDSINQTRFSNKKFLIQEYKDLRYKIGRTPSVYDFYKFAEISLDLVFKYRKNFHLFLLEMEQDYKFILSDHQNSILSFLSQEISNGKRFDELIILKEILDNKLVQLDDLLTKYHKENVTQTTIDSAINVLTLDFFKQDDRRKYGDSPLVVKQRDSIGISSSFESNLNDGYFKTHIMSLITYSIERYYDEYSNNSTTPFILNMKYSRKDYCRLRCWSKDESSVIYGYKVKNDTTPIFVTYEKHADISDSTKYPDKFIDQNTISWMTRSRVTLKSTEVIKISNQRNNGMIIELFVKKDDYDGSDFYYLGELIYLSHSQTEIIVNKNTEEKEPIVNIHYKMLNPVKEDIYDYLHKILDDDISSNT
jgi:superfamily II DNA or RNA helicase